MKIILVVNIVCIVLLLAQAVAILGRDCGPRGRADRLVPKYALRAAALAFPARR